MATEAAAKPLPEPTRDSKPYWDGLNEGRLPLQQCAACRGSGEECREWPETEHHLPFSNGAWAPLNYVPSPVERR